MRDSRMYWLIFGGLVVGFLGGVWMTKAMEPSSAEAQIHGDPLYHDDTTKNVSIVLRWQEVGGNMMRTIHRARVPGGWLVAQQEGLTYIPDPEGEWR